MNNRTSLSFPGTWDRAVRLRSVVYLTLATVIVTAIVFALGPGIGESPLAGLTVSVSLVGLLALVGLFGLAPRRYVVTVQCIIIECGFRSIRLPLMSITDIRELERDPLDGARPVLASNGFFGYWGRFHSSTLGAIRAYATRSDRYVIISTPEGPVIVTPDDPSGFTNAVRERRQHLLENLDSLIDRGVAE